MRIFVTGGTGYVGGALCRRLAGAGHELTCLVRPTSQTVELERLGAQCFVGDIRDRYSMREGMSGADWVIHAAAVLDHGVEPETMRLANVEGSENVASLAYKLGVGRFLSVSSVAYFGGSSEDGTPATEGAPIQPFPSRYSATKHAGQQAIAAWAEQGLDVISVYPSLVYGPPGKKSGVNPLIRRLAKGWMPAVVAPDRRTSWVFIEDVVEAMRRIVESRPGTIPTGRDFLLAGDRATIGEIVERVTEVAGVEPPKLRLSVTMARLLTRLAAPFYRLRGRRPPIDIEQLGSLERHWSFDDSRARRELDWRPRPLEEGLPETVEYLMRM